MPVVSSPLDAAVDHAAFDSGDESSDGSRTSEGEPDPVGPEEAALSVCDVSLNYESEGEGSDDETPLEEEVQATPGTNVLTLHPNDPRAGQSGNCKTEIGAITHPVGNAGAVTPDEHLMAGGFRFPL